MTRKVTERAYWGVVVMIWLGFVGLDVATVWSNGHWDRLPQALATVSCGSLLGGMIFKLAG